MEASSKHSAPIETHVGMRELRQNFRKWMNRARAGERIVVTDRGVQVAELGPLRKKRSRLQEMRDQGLVIPATRKPGELPPLPSGPISTRGTDALREERDGARY